jgi:nicotinamide riboside kinase
MEKIFQSLTPPEPDLVSYPTLLSGARCQKNSALLLNLFGGPGIGKTTLAARIFAELKARNIEAACPEEYAKIAIWQGRSYLLDNQLILLGRTWDTITSLADKVDVIILDSPILLCSHYAGDAEPEHFHQTVLDYHRRHDRMNILLKRTPGMTYSTSGRRETSQQAIGIDARIETLLDMSGEAYASVENASDTASDLIEYVSEAVFSRNSSHISKSA